MIRTSSKSRAAIAGLCALVFGLQGLAIPLARAEPSAADVTTAKSLVVEGRGLRAKGQHAAARDRFKGAWALVPTPIIGMDLAREHVALAELVEGREIAIAITKLPTIPKESDESRSARADAAKLANELAARIPSVVITVAPMPAGATVQLDGGPVPAATLGVPRKLNPGKHEIVVRVGAKETARTVTLGEGQERAVTIDGKELIGTGGDPSPTSTAPKTATSLEAGRPTWAWIALGAGGVGAVLGVVGTATAFGGASKFNEANDECKRLLGANGNVNVPQCLAGGSLEAQRTDGQSQKTTGLVLASVGGAVLVGGVLLFAIAPSNSKERTMATGMIGVAFSPSGFSVTGRF